MHPGEQWKGRICTSSLRPYKLGAFIKNLLIQRARVPKVFYSSAFYEALVNLPEQGVTRKWVNERKSKLTRVQFQ